MTSRYSSNDGSFGEFKTQDAPSETRAFLARAAARAVGLSMRQQELDNDLQMSKDSISFVRFAADTPMSTVPVSYSHNKTAIGSSQIYGAGGGGAATSTSSKGAVKGGAARDSLVISLQQEVDRLKRKLNGVLASAEEVLVDAQHAQEEAKRSFDNKLAMLDEQVNKLSSGT